MVLPSDSGHQRMPSLSMLTHRFSDRKRPQILSFPGFVMPNACKEQPEKIEPKLKVLKVRADGRCMFRSIAKCISFLKKVRLSDAEEKASADILRAAAYKVICVQKRQWFDRMGFLEGDIETYCNRMKFADFFGGEPELYVLSEEVLKRPIAIYMHKEDGELNKLLEYGSKWATKDTKLTIRLLYNGINHYDCLVPDTD